MIEFEVGFVGEERILRNLSTAKERLEDVLTPLHQVGTLILKDTQANFDSHGELYGGWPGLSVRTYEQKARKGYPTYTLVRTGQMERSFRASIIGSGEALELRVFNLADYFKYHQSSAARTKLPRRVMLKLRETITREITEIFRKHAHQAIKEASG